MVTVFKEATFVNEENYGFNQLLGNAVLSNTIEIRDQVENVTRKYKKLELKDVAVSKRNLVLIQPHLHFTLLFSLSSSMNNYMSVHGHLL